MASPNSSFLHAAASENLAFLRDNAHHKSQKSEVIGIDAKKNQCLDDDSQDHSGAGANALRNHALLKHIQFDGEKLFGVLTEIVEQLNHLRRKLIEILVQFLVLGQEA